MVTKLSYSIASYCLIQVGTCNSTDFVYKAEVSRNFEKPFKEPSKCKYELLAVMTDCKHLSARSLHKFPSPAQ